ncbi:non-homologous end-joining DNA ligase [Alicyclobacillus tolerans]|uniref:non-homologous end-joining DNA ligase n=1 Tax=Alicyclobacillus tolerans TaxID=90970 RepID=UPI001F22E3B7|nr:non-homologous end-joining DNA ligase [Alicyclobacillus tolerans]MCF8563790.1 non-homologous end-joining DNA ligase [Alicyclobacillus tolerans]
MQLEAEYPVLITHPEKLLWPEAKVSKVQYIQYMIRMAPWLLPHLKDRPLTLIRFPNGIHGHSFYQKNRPQGTPEWMTTVPIWSTDRNDVIHYILADSVAALIWLANMACLEFHVGFTTVDRPEEPKAVAFDLDPTIKGFEPVREVALAIHGLLTRLGLSHVAKTSGATGLQVFVPLAPGHTYAQTRLFTKAVADYLLHTLPNVVTLERLTKNRGRKVYVDYLQHGPTRTLIAPYSPRATVHATVSCPLSWRELEAGAVPEQFTVNNVPERVEQIGDLMNCGPAANLRAIASFLSANPGRSL